MIIVVPIYSAIPFITQCSFTVHASSHQSPPYINVKGNWGCCGTFLKRELCYKEGLWCEEELSTNSENIPSPPTPAPPQSLEKLTVTNPDPGAKKVGDRWFRLFINKNKVYMQICIDLYIVLVQIVFPCKYVGLSFFLWEGLNLTLLCCDHAATGNH